jgi:hypothetical protein
MLPLHEPEIPIALCEAACRGGNDQPADARRPQAATWFVLGSLMWTGVPKS